jgi:uncharacterized membrane protein
MPSGWDSIQEPNRAIRSYISEPASGFRSTHEREEAMGQGSWWIMDIVGPAILLIVLVWLVLKVRSNRDGPLNRESERGARDVYAEEEARRREGTDKL